jgi:hypothetical protein
VGKVTENEGENYPKFQPGLLEKPHALPIMAAGKYLHNEMII